MGNFNFCCLIACVFVVVVVVVVVVVLIFLELETTEGGFFQRFQLYIWAISGNYLVTVSIKFQSLKNTKREPKTD